MLRHDAGGGGWFTRHFAGMSRCMAAKQRKNGANAEGALDDTNLALIAELQSEARLSLAELGRRVGLSAPAVADRLARLEDSGVIRGHRAHVQPPAPWP